MVFPILGWVAVATVGAIVAGSRSSSRSSSSDDREEREEEALEEALAKRNKKIKKDIKQYKKTSIKRFADKYGVDIEFGTYNVEIISLTDTKDPIEILEEENIRLSQFIEHLQEMRDEAAG